MYLYGLQGTFYSGRILVYSYILWKNTVTSFCKVNLNLFWEVDPIYWRKQTSIYSGKSTLIYSRKTTSIYSLRTQSALVERLMDIVNPWFPAKDRVTWDRVAFGTFHWLEARTMFTLDQKADYERQLRREGMELNDLEVATQKLWQDWMEADEIKSKQQQAKAAAQHQLPPERRAAQLEQEKQARVTGAGHLSQCWRSLSWLGS